MMEMGYGEQAEDGHWPAAAEHGPSIDLGLDVQTAWDGSDLLNHRDPVTGALDPARWSERQHMVADLAAVRARTRWAGCTELLTVADWADLHPGEAVAPVEVPGQERAVRVGGDGTPLIAEFAIAEMAALLERSVFAGRKLLADVVDLRHRLPLLWGRVVRCEVKAWQARTIAQATRPLTLGRARQVDGQISAQVGRLAWSRMIAIVDAAVIAADPDRAARLAEQARLEAKVHVGQSDEHGLATVYARLETSDAVWLKAQVARLADLLATVRGDQRPVDQRRAAALGLLARPAEAIRLMLEQPRPAGPTDPSDGDPEPPEPDEPVVIDPVTAAIIDRIHCLDPERLAPPAVLYAHVAWDTLHTGSGVCRVQDVGPVVAPLVQRWLCDSSTTVKAVIDIPGGRMPVDTYEVPDRMREQLHLRQPFSVHPFGVTGSNHGDIDHTRAYRWPGPGELLEPGQTGLPGLGPLGRFEHRLVTHGGWQRRQPEPGTYLVRAPHGHTWLINTTGTHHVGHGDFADAVWQTAMP